MALLGKADPKDIIGMEPSDLQDKLKKLEGTASKEDVDSISTKLNSQLDEIKAALAALKPAPPPPDPDPTDAIDDPAARLLADPDKFVAKKTQAAEELALQTRAELQELRARQKYPVPFQKWEKKLIELRNQAPVSMRARDDFWEANIRYVVGDRTLAGEFKDGSFPSLLGGSTVSNEDGVIEDANRGFHPEVADWLKRRKIPLENAEAIRKIMSENGDPISAETYKEMKAAKSA